MDMAEVFISVANRMKAEYQASQQTSHRPSKGRSRESILLDDYLRKYLPRNVELAHGAEIVTTADEVSGECDVVICDQATPPLLDSKGYRVLPIECVHGVIEVKTDLDRSELRKVVAKIANVKGFQKRARAQGGPDEFRGIQRYGKEWWDFFPTAGYIFAYSATDLVSLSHELQELQEGTALEHRIDSIYVLDQGVITNHGSQGVVFRSDHALVAMTIELQALCQHIWMPRFQISDYFGERALGVVARTYSLE